MARKSATRALDQPITPEFGGAAPHPRLAQLLVYWNKKRGDSALPSRTDLDPVAFKFLLGHILLIEVQKDPLQFRVRLQGSELSWIGCNLTRKTLDQVPCAELYALAFSYLAETVETQAPAHKVGAELIDDMHRKFEALLLPLASDGVTVDMVLAAVLCRDDRAP